MTMLHEFNLPVGIVLAGGNGTRLRPMTSVTNKHLLGVYDKPMIYYPIETLRDSFSITNILVVSGGDHIGDFAELLGDGESLGVNLTYRVQKEASGIAGALGLARDFAAGRPVVVILGDNIFTGKIPKVTYIGDKATIFLKEVPDPKRFGVAVFNKHGTCIAVEEKPKKPKSKFAVTGLYCYPKNVFDIVSTLVPSKRNELEISDVNNWYIKNSLMNVEKVSGRWFDAGTPDSLLKASVHVASTKRVDSK